MELLTGDDFFDLFSSFEKSAFHIELKDTYTTPEEDGPFRRFLQGEPDDFSWHAHWLETVRRTTATGRTIERVRVVSTPHTDYTRWGLAVARLNIEAGENIRYLRRENAPQLRDRTDDFWLFDDARPVFTVFTPSGQWMGGVATSDPVLGAQCRAVYEYTWNRAIPYSEYVRA